ncbi:MAG TPA: CHASE2 domain-containing protein, partial [Holophaga sp.]|nr:CHASE2 domain-containing protein [Holophaga sp.]
VALDMVFAEPDAGSLANWQGGLARELGLDVQVRGLPPGQADFDALLGSTLARGSFVLGYKFQLPPEQGSRDCLLHPLPLILRREPGAPARPDLFAATGATCNLPVLARAAGASGFFNIVPDPDGVIRRMPLLMTCGDQVYPCLPLALLAKAEGASQAILELDAAGPRSLRVGRHEIPVDPRGDLLIHFRGRGGGFEYVSAGSLLRGTVPPGQLKGRFVLVGTSAAGLRELRATPLDGAFNGVEVHATVLDNLLRGDFLAQPASAWAWEALAILVAGLVSSLAFARFGARLSGVLAVLSILALLGGGACLLAGRGLFLQPLLALLTVAGNFGLLTWWKSRTEERALGLRTQELLQTQDLTIHSMAALGEARDPETGAHLRRTQHYVRVLALKLRENPKYRRQIDDDFVEALSKMAPLHDIGKIGIPDRILLKPEGLTEEEFEVMKSHTLVAGRIFEEARAEFGPNSFLVVAEEVCRGHHEKWDGSGYPLGLKGEEIPLAARIMALADVYDAAVSPRVYKDSIAPDVVAATLAAKSGTHFDPGIVVAFLAIQDDFARIAERYRR